MKLTIISAVLLGLCFVAADLAFAQGTLIGAGGGNGTGFLDWLFTNALNVIFGLAIIFCGIMVATGHHEFMRIGMAVVGILIAYHWRDVLNALGANV